MSTGYYDPLISAMDEQDHGEESHNQNSETQGGLSKKNPKPPPIILPNTKLSDVMKHVSEAVDQKSTVQYKVTDSDTRILAQNETDFVLIRKHLTDKEIPFCTHPLRAEKKVKICLYGLVEMDCNTLKDELKKSDVHPAEIKMINPKGGYTGEARIYILYFNKLQNIKIADLRAKVTGLLNLRVKFEYYSPRKFGPTQCVRCQGLGHGAQNCNLPIYCVTCAGKHESKACPHRKPVTPTKENPHPKPKAPNELVKCALCHENHTANYSKCRIREQFTITSRSKTRNTKPNRPATNLDLNQFPPLPNTIRNDWFQHNSLNATTSSSGANSHALEMQLQMMHSFQQMQKEMFTAMQSMLQEIKSLLQLVSQHTKNSQLAP